MKKLKLYEIIIWNPNEQFWQREYQYHVFRAFKDGKYFRIIRNDAIPWYKDKRLPHQMFDSVAISECRIIRRIK